VADGAVITDYALLQVFLDSSYYSVTQSVLEPECGGAVSTLNYTFHGWGYWENQRVQPCVDRWHWLENKRITHVCDRCASPRGKVTCFVP
jgi:hypothetical protein